MPPRDTRVQPRDVILVHVQDKPAFYARVEEILPDVKKGWLQLRFQVLTLPLQELTWILEPVQIDGEPFTMGGTPIRIERLPDPSPAAAAGDEKDEEEEAGGTEPAPKSKETTPQVIAFPGKTKK